MQALALLALFLHNTASMFLDGQTFSHAVVGILCGIVALVLWSVVSTKTAGALDRMDDGCAWPWPHDLVLDYITLGLSLSEAL